MGMYAFITEEDRVTKRVVADPEINEAFQEALKYDPSLMVEQYDTVKVKYVLGFTTSKPHAYWNIYHEAPAFDGSACQMRYQSSGSGSKEVVIAYLHGIINCGLHQINPSHMRRK